MRAGCFAETRVINLLNRRFVNFYYNTDQGPPTKDVGKDPAAKAFLNGKTKNKWAFFAAFTAEGEPLGVTDVYATKDNTFDFLVGLLRENPEYDQFTKEEETLLAKAAAEANNLPAQLEAGKLLEDLGRYKEAEAYYRRIIAQEANNETVAEAYRGLMRMARYSRKWEPMEAFCRQIEERKGGEQLRLQADVAMERAFRLNAESKYAEMRALLEKALKSHPDTKRRSELHFYAGVACFFLKEKDWAYYHWCWVVENLPDDRMTRRCFIAAAHEGMPYANPELGGFRSGHPGGNIDVINSAYENARLVYEKLKEKW
jgi:tetratricopeptide (TPR) repeat protein